MIILKENCRGIFGKIMIGLYSLKGKSLNEIISFPKIMEKIGRSCALKKADIWTYLLGLSDMGNIEIICGKGVRILYELK